MDQMAYNQQLQSVYDRGDYGRAMQMALQLTRQNPLNVYPLQVLAQIKLLQGLWNDAESIAQKAQQLDPKNALTTTVLARIYGARGETDEAIKLCDDAIELDPTLELAHTCKAQFLERVGRVDEALKVLESISDAKGFSAIQSRCQLRAGDINGAIETTSNAAKELADNSKMRYTLLKTQAKALDKAGRYDEALALLNECNSIARPSNYTVLKLVSIVDKVIHTFSAENLATFKRASDPKRQHILIAGMPRSGTTLVEQILDAHPDVEGAGEVKEIDMYAKRLPKTHKFRKPYPDCMDLLTTEDLTTMGADYEQALSDYGYNNASVVINKNLQNMMHLGFASMLFPNMKVIFTQRDPRDIAVSCLMGTFRPELFPYLFTVSDTLAACEQMDRLQSHWESVLDVEMTTINYCSMVTNQDEESKRLVEFCGLQWDDRCLRFWESDRTVMTLAYDQVTKPMYNSSIDRWKNYQSLFED